MTVQPGGTTPPDEPPAPIAASRRAAARREGRARRPATGTAPGGRVTRGPGTSWAGRCRAGAAGAERVPDDLALPPAEALALAQRMLDTGRAFHAHEVLEASWKQAPAAERELWRGLAQLAVGLTHAQRGNARGAAALLRRGGGAGRRVRRGGAATTSTRPG